MFTGPELPIIDQVHVEPVLRATNPGLPSVGERPLGQAAPSDADVGYIPARKGLAYTALYGTIAIATLGFVGFRSQKLPDDIGRLLQVGRKGRLTGSLGPDIAPPRPAPGHVGLKDLILWLNANPRDGAVRFELALRLLAQHERALGLQHLQQAFRSYPEGILRLLQEPRFARLRGDAEVRAILRRYHWDQQRRLFSGYT